MILGTRELIHYLIRRGFLSSREIVNGQLRVIDMSRRNLNTRILTGKKGLFVKQPKNLDAPNVASFHREALAYHLSTSHAEAPTLASLLPGFHFFDSKDHVLVIDDIGESEDVAQFHSRKQCFPTDVASRIGAGLATYHRIMNCDMLSGVDTAAFPRKPPWILSIYNQEAVPVSDTGSAPLRILEIVRKYGDFHNLMRELEDEWRIECLIHGDMKLQNCIVELDTSGSDASTVKIVDWELADLGDSAWDIGGIFQAYLCNWVFSMNPSAEPGEEALRNARFPLEKIVPAMSAFWDTYSAAVSDQKSLKDLLNRSIRYAAARMVQTVYEYMFHSPDITPHAVRLMQLSLNMLSKPEESINTFIDSGNGGNNG